MAADIKGTAIVWAMGGVTFTAGIVSGTNASMPQSLRHSRSAENTKIKDTAGDVKTIVYHGPMKSISISVVPSASSIAAAVTSKEAHIIAIGTKVTVADASGTCAIEGNWIVSGVTENRSVDGVVTIDLELENSSADDLSTSAS
jgi:hypothetical protein